MIEWKCPNCLTQYDVDDKYAQVLRDKKDCKFCVRKDPDIPTTAEMDGLKTVEDIRSRFDMVFQCINDNKWKLHQNFDGTHKPCDNCGEINYDTAGGKSYRTYNPLTDNKKRVSAKLRNR